MVKIRSCYWQKLQGVGKLSRTRCIKESLSAICEWTCSWVFFIPTPCSVWSLCFVRCLEDINIMSRLERTFVADFYSDTQLSVHSVLHGTVYICCFNELSVCLTVCVFGKFYCFLLAVTRRQNKLAIFCLPLSKSQSVHYRVTSRWHWSRISAVLTPAAANELARRVYFGYSARNFYAKNIQRMYTVQSRRRRQAIKTFGATADQCHCRGSGEINLCRCLSVWVKVTLRYVSDTVTAMSSDSAVRNYRLRIPCTQKYEAAERHQPRAAKLITRTVEYSSRYKLRSRPPRDRMIYDGAVSHMFRLIVLIVSVRPSVAIACAMRVSRFCVFGDHAKLL